MFFYTCQYCNKIISKNLSLHLTSPTQQYRQLIVAGIAMKYFACGKMNLNGKVRRVQEGKRTSPPAKAICSVKMRKHWVTGCPFLILHFAFCTLHLAFTP